MEDLIERLEKATGPDLDINAEIAQTVFGLELLNTDYLYTKGPDGKGVLVPAYTSSLDAALTLVPEGWGGDIEIGDTGNIEGKRVSLWNGEFAPYTIECKAEAATPPIALCLACLKARSA